MESKIRLVIADDDEDDCYLLELALRSSNQNIEITTVPDAVQLFQFLESATPPSVLILDLNLPLIDGFEVLKRLKSDDRLSTMAVIVITTSGVEADVKRAYQLGANAFITKPDVYSDLQKIIDSFSLFWFQAARLPSPVNG